MATEAALTIHQCILDVHPAGFRRSLSITTRVLTVHPAARIIHGDVHLTHRTSERNSKQKDSAAPCELISRVQSSAPQHRLSLYIPHILFLLPQGLTGGNARGIRTYRVALISDDQGSISVTITPAWPILYNSSFLTMFLASVAGMKYCVAHNLESFRILAPGQVPVGL